MRTQSDCPHTTDTIVRDLVGDADHAANQRHLQDCPLCAKRVRMRQAVQEGVFAENDQLDDLTRLRVLARLRETIDGAAACKVSPLRRLWARVVWPSALVATAVVLLVAGHRLRAPVVALSPPSPSLVLKPYALQTATEPTRTDFSRPLDRLELPARTTMRAHLATMADLTLLGPLELVVSRADEQLVELQLTRGTLIGDYDGSRGGTLRIRSRDATIGIVGTLFLVEAGPDGTRVSVAHGRVRVESRGTFRTLNDNQSWSTSSPQVESMSAATAKLFQQANSKIREPAASTSTLEPVRTSTGPVDAATRVSRRSRPAGPAATAVAFLEREEPPRPASPMSEPRVAPRGDSPSSPALRPLPPQSPPATAGFLYGQAEVALRQGDAVQGERLLSELVLRFPDDAMTDAARYELALLSEKSEERKRALTLANEIIRGPRSGPFIEPARFLKCRLEFERGEKAAAASCFAGFTEDYPRSPHNALALKMLIELSVEASDCRMAVGFAETYLARHRRGAFASQAERIRDHCGQ